MIGSGRFARWSRTISVWLPGLICAGVAALAWFGYRAAAEWQHSSGLLVDRRVDEVADTMVTGLTRDMRAVQTTILDGREWGPTSGRSDLLEVVASAFARYPYPEVFFAWEHSHDGTFYARSDRLPPWLAAAAKGPPYPVETLRNDGVSDQILTRITKDIAVRRRHSVFDVSINGIPYQVVARPIYGDVDGRTATAGLAVLVNLDWVYDNYFGEIAGQVARIAGAGEGIVPTIVDERGRILPSLSSTVTSRIKEREFTLAFFDPLLVSFDPPADLPLRTWTIRVGAAAEPTLALAATASRQTLVAIAAAAVALAFGLVFTARAGRAMANVSEMRSDFVSTVTHDLKTPVQVIRSIGETMARGRVTTDELRLEFAQLLEQEGRRLSRLIDNLLAYSRVTDVAQLYSFEAHDPHDLVTEALRGFQRVIADSGFSIRVDVPDDLPPIRADRTSIVLALDNLIDNAMRYSKADRHLEVIATERHGNVEISVTDRGVGIPAEELELVKRRFTRGRAAQGRGSGLGLAIVNRIATDHGGTLRISSVPDAGTTATLCLPVSV